jgi:hypothetical protein
MTLHFIHNHWNTYFLSSSFVDFYWIWPNDRTVVRWSILFIVIITPMTRPCINVVLDRIIWTNMLSVIHEQTASKWSHGMPVKQVVAWDVSQASGPAPKLGSRFFPQP